MGPKRTRCTVAAALAAAAVTMAASAASAQVSAERGAIHGVVVEAESDRAVVGATVTLHPLADSTDAGHPELERRVLTDLRGRYTFSDVPHGRYRVEVSQIGYRTVDVWIDLPESWVVRRSVGLVVEPIELPPIDITVLRLTPSWLAPGVAGAEEAPAETNPALRHYRLAPTLDARTVSAEGPGAIGPMGDADVLTGLQRLPGVSSQGDFSAALWTRGAPWGFTQVTLDGLPLYDPLHLGGIATGVPPEALGRVTLLPGVRPPSLSDGVAGTVVLGTKRAEERAVAAGVSPSAVQMRAEDRWLQGRLGLAVTARRSWWDVVDPPSIFGAGGSEGPVDYRFADASARMDLRVGDVLVEAGGLWEGDHLEGEIPDLVHRSRGDWGNRTGWIRLSRPVGPVRVEAMGGRVDYDAETAPLPWASLQRWTGVPALSIMGTHLEHRVRRLAVEGGTEDGTLAWSLGGQTIRESVAQLVQRDSEAVEPEIPGSDGPVTLERRVGWMEATARLGSVNLAGGVRWDVPDTPEIESATLPSLRIRWMPFHRLALEAAVGRSRQHLYPLAPAGSALGPDLRIGHQWILAGEERAPLEGSIRTLSGAALLGGGVSVHLNLWRRQVDGFWMYGVSALEEGQILPPPLVSGAQGSEEGEGFEVAVRRTRGRIHGEVAYSRAKSQFVRDPEHNWPSPAGRRHSVDVSVLAQLSRGLSAGVLFTGESGWPFLTGPAAPCPDEEVQCTNLPDDFEQPDSYRLSWAPAYASLDLVARWTKQTGWVTWDVSGALRNVLGRDNAAAWGSSACQGRKLISPVCERIQGLGEFSPGLTRPTPSATLRVRF